MAEKISVALWGYGLAGRTVEKIIKTQLFDEYAVTAVFDRDPLGVVNTGSGTFPVTAPGMIPEYYDKGLFSAVIPCVFRQDQKQEILSFLNDLRIPAIEPDNRRLIRPVSFFNKADRRTLPEAKGYTVSALNDMYITVMPELLYPFITDGKGHICEAYWRDYYADSAPLCTYFFPSPDRLPDASPVLLEGEWCVPGNLLNRNYWHFLFETLDQVYILEDSGFSGRYILPRTSFSEELLTLAGISPERVLFTDDMEPGKHYAFESLITLELDHCDRRNAAPVLLKMAEKIIGNIPSAGKEYPEKVYVKRIGSRKLVLPEGFAKKRGFTEIIPERLSVAEQILYFHNARIVLSPHGANSANSLFMRPGSVFIETFPRNYTNACCLETLCRSGVSYLTVPEVITEETPDPDDHGRDYRIPGDLLDMALRNALLLSKDPEK